MNENPLNIEAIKELQDDDPELDKWKKKYPDSYFSKTIGRTHDVLCYVKPGNDKKSQCPET